MIREPLVREVLRWGGLRLAAAGALVVAAGLLDGLGLLLLIPLIELAGSGAARLDWAFAALGLATPGARLAALAAAFAALVALRFVVVRRSDLVRLRLREGFLVHLRGRLFGLIAAAGWARAAGLDRARAGHALTSSVERAATSAGLVIDIGVAALMLAVQLGFAFWLSPWLALAAAAAGAGLFAALAPMRARARRRGERLTADDLGVFESTTRFLAGLKPATAHGMVADHVAAHGAASRRLAEARLGFGADQTLARLAMQSAVALIALALVLAGLLLLAMPAAELLVLLALLTRLSGPLIQIQTLLQHVRHGAAAYASATGLLEPLAAGTPAPGTAPPIARAPEIRFEGVTALGAGGEVLLADVTAAIPAGRVTALAGPSGAGKTTFCDLAAGLTAPGAGRVLLDGAPLEARALAPRLAYVGQEPFMVEDTLRANLLWGAAPGCGAPEIAAALEAVGAAGLVAGLPDGLETRVMSQGPRFSGGERQRLRLARALLRRPLIVVLDEATGALDAAAEAEVLRGFLGALGGATVLMVSHRAEVLAFAGHVVRLDAGRVVASA